MATDLSQDSVLQYLRSGGGSVKNADLLLHFRSFIRDHADRERNRELFKKYVNSVATVQQLDGVSYVVLRRKFKGRVPGGGEGGSAGPQRPTTAVKREPSPGNARVSPASSANKPRQTPQPREVTTSAPQGGNAMKTVLPVAGIMLNNNNVETNFNLKQPEINKPSHHGGPAEAQTISLSQPSAPDQSSKTRHNDTGFYPPAPGVTPAVPAVRYYGETRQQIAFQEPLRGREAERRTPSFPEPPAQDWNTQMGQHQVGFVPPASAITPPVSAVGQHGETRQPLQIQEPLRGREAEEKTPRFSKPPAQDWNTKMGQNQVGFVPPVSTITPVVSAVRQHGETRQQIPIQEPLRGREAEMRPPDVSVLPAPDQSSKKGPHETGFGPSAPVISTIRPNEETVQVPDPPDEGEASLQPERGLHQEPPLPQVSLKFQVAPRRRHRHRKSYKSAVSYDEDENEEEEEEAPIRRGSAGGEWPLSVPLGTMGKAISASSPCIIDVPSVVPSSSSEKGLPKIYVQDVVEERLPPRSGPGWRLESEAEIRGQWAGTESEPGSIRHSLPLEVEHYVQPSQSAPSKDVYGDRRYSQPAGVHLEQGWGLQQSQRGSLSSSTSNLYAPSSDSGLAIRDVSISGSSRGLGWNSSLEDLRNKTGLEAGGAQIQEVLIRAQRTRAEPSMLHAGTKTQAPWHHSTGHLLDDQEPMTHLSPFYHSSDHLHVNQQFPGKPWHLSTGDLDDHHEAELSEASSSSPKLRPHSGIPRRLSSHLRSRMCRSMGADLDQLQQEEARGGSEAARLNRLHLISSSLSLRYDVSSSSLSSCSTPPRSHSLASLAEVVEGRDRKKSLPSSSASPPEGSGRQSQVPLESREHEWLVKGAAGTWPDIYSLFREDSTLLNKRDFISGFTVLHWIAKHGDHRVLNTLWYGVQKAGMDFDINARSTCGHTPLHIAAIHGHKNIMRLLVSKFKANLKLRDTAGKRPWQYLSSTTSPEIFQLLGAPAKAAFGGEGGGVGRSESFWKPEKQHQQRRRRRHHLSSASSAERPTSFSAKVKRSSSLAAFLKHKSLLHFHGHQSDSSL
ncbi:uncharacterized protein sowahb [Halichoeres trimaculatus]|uniref:uncharacterized protein sowahb n=1 Tax=Halichoeres trimaculatus TaxID=147232 RepID=UPI003D9EB9B5